MGCDIHAYIEFKETGCDGWSSFGGRINPGRHYGIFAKLADVRNNYKIVPVAKPRGMPDDAAYKSEGESRLYITETEGDGFCTHIQAASYVQSGEKYINDASGKPAWVTHPDWHSYSWATAAEIEDALADPKVEAGAALEYRAIVAAMRYFESAGCAARLVFWFDN